MRVTCPTCEAAYEVPAHLLSPTRRLKCAQCDSQWVPQMPGAEAVAVAPPPPAPEPAAAPPPPPPPPPPKPAREPEPEPVTASVGELRERVAAAERSEPPPKPRQPVLLTMAWAATFVLVASGFWGAYTYRGKVMQAWPPSQRAYAALGLDAEVK